MGKFAGMNLTSSLGVRGHVKFIQGLPLFLLFSLKKVVIRGWN